MSLPTLVCKVNYAAHVKKIMPLKREQTDVWMFISIFIAYFYGLLTVRSEVWA